ncbi:hypothetical protein TAMA11512_09090 [Selenomonas sp. TAMA-11512]|uniref:hypothetical protein n=1 Tax=Selenomonas sp. TAMA-11512 TaxID=3095337 RepID=UPI003090BDEA|nr:hypothetical protein TAMA11512_09090 [Selenomonas sp. TAMA-11512]
MIENDAALKMADEIRADRKRAESMLLNYAEEMKVYHLKREEYVRGMPAQGGGGNLPGNPTQAEALRGVQFDETYHAYTWLRAVEFVERGLSERKRIFLDARRRASRGRANRGRRAWLVVTQRLYCDAMRERFLNTEFFVSERTLQEMWRYVVDRTVEAYLKLEQKKLNRHV